jgi:hypothetical protein
MLLHKSAIKSKKEKEKCYAKQAHFSPNGPTVFNRPSPIQWLRSLSHGIKAAEP